MRPRTLAEYIGQSHLLGPGKPLRRVLEQGHTHSMILWGPPGTGKTTLATMIANTVNADIENISAVLAGVKDIREAVARAQQRLAMGKRTIMFVDEVHRFNKSQQDAFFPFVEDGTLIFIGATTENPSFELNSALLSRARVYVLKSLTDDELRLVLQRALTDPERGLGSMPLQLEDQVTEKLIALADGDARRLLNLLEIASDLAEEQAGNLVVGESAMHSLLGEKTRRFDKGGEQFYDQISALHKSVRGSDPDASLYWLCRMLDGGCDGLYLARRIVRMAIEDIGNADPRALDLCLNAWDVQERLGSPEGELALAQAVIYLACAPKSNAAYMAYNEARADVQNEGSLEVPVHLRNAPTKLMKELGYGRAYRYAHDEPNAFAAGESYFPEGKAEQQYYRPVERGMEIQIREKLQKLKQLNQQARQSGRSKP
ncbi:replication-associated recombination protein A [Permianibacter aggregans]|uniref:replication-associated recombination protein A n=1 Tax=Permianibacter aggregans TaxID=1510150 RepID=UPI0012FC8846|nr:replication-associated recombination protein A [Permianibacter aggregans]QGX38343.1 replication-associated recombination protein A [Permianibacter aggregans]